MKSTFRRASCFASVGLLALTACGGVQDNGDDADSDDLAVVQQALNASRHRKVTEVGLGPWVYNTTSLSELISFSTIGDEDPATHHRSEAHFDNCYWSEGVALVASKRKEAVSKAITFLSSPTAANKTAVFKAFGYVLHATEDFYSHSNWAETHASGTICPFDDIAKPSSWYSGTYNNWDDSGPNAGYLHCPADQRVPHSEMNKDDVGGLINDEVFIDASVAVGDQMRRFIAALRAARPADANTILSGLGIVNTNPANSASRADFRRTIAPAGGPWGQTGPSVFCKPGSYVASFRQRVESLQGANADDTALNAIDLWCRDSSNNWTERLNTWNGAWGDWSAWSSCPNGAFVTRANLKIEPHQGTNDDTSANGARFTCSTGSLLSANNDGAWGAFGSTVACGAGEAVCGAQTVVEAPLGSDADDTALNGIKLHCCAL